jgi:hypothetical protein
MSGIPLTAAPSKSVAICSTPHRRICTQWRKFSRRCPCLISFKCDRVNRVDTPLAFGQVVHLSCRIQPRRQRKSSEHQSISWPIDLSHCRNLDFDGPETTQLHRGDLSDCDRTSRPIGIGKLESQLGKASGAPGAVAQLFDRPSVTSVNGRASLSRGGAFPAGGRLDPAVASSWASLSPDSCTVLG